MNGLMRKQYLDLFTSQDWKLEYLLMSLLSSRHTVIVQLESFHLFKGLPKRLELEALCDCTADGLLPRELRKLNLCFRDQSYECHLTCILVIIGLVGYIILFHDVSNYITLHQPQLAPRRLLVRSRSLTAAPSRARSRAKSQSPGWGGSERSPRAGQGCPKPREPNMA